MKDEFAPSAGDNIVKVNESIGFNDQAFANHPLVDALSLIEQMKGVFAFSLGQKVINRHNESGYIDLCGIDFRGVIYLVHLPEGQKIWYTEFELKPDESDPQEDPNVNLKSDQKIKTDIPQPKKD